MEDDRFEKLSVVDRKSVLLFKPENLAYLSKIAQTDLSKLKNSEFDHIADEIVGYHDLSLIEQKRIDDYAESTLGKAKWSKKSASTGYSSAYRHIKKILKASGMKDGDTFVDLGASYGRVGCVVGANFPNSLFFGYEIIKERLLEAQRVAKLLDLENVTYIHADLSADDLILPQADWFFLYDSVNDKTLEHILKKIHGLKGDREAHLIAKFTGGLRKYAESPYLELIKRTGKVGSFDECWFYRFRQAEQRRVEASSTTLVENVADTE